MSMCETHQVSTSVHQLSYDTLTVSSSWFHLYFSSTAGVMHVWCCGFMCVSVLQSAAFSRISDPAVVFARTWTALLSSSPFSSTSAARFWCRSTIASVKASYVTRYSGSFGLTFHHTARVDVLHIYESSSKHSICIQKPLEHKSSPAETRLPDEHSVSPDQRAGMFHLFILCSLTINHSRRMVFFSGQQS